MGFTTRLPALAIAACVAAGCRTAAPSSTPGREQTPASIAAADSAAIARARADSARYPYTDADIHFMSGMIAHHAQAIEMSRLAPTNGAGASVRTLAERIINAQQDEIAIMQQWLRDRRQPVPDPGMADMAAHHEDHPGMMMPGMLTAEQLQQLRSARGAEFDRLFLTGMIQHHRGAIAMVTTLFATPGAAQDQSVFKIASDVNVDQTTEVARMTTMLSALLFERPP
jgi:uncharacterized protein (DUF305 family)